MVFLHNIISNFIFSLNMMVIYLTCILKEVKITEY